MIEFDPNISSILSNAGRLTPETAGPAAAKADFSGALKTLGNCITKVDDMQQASDACVQDLLTGKNNDITAVVSAVAKADMSFKVLVGVRNKLIEAYKQTMNMPL
jgi:flagellar hook-basal body complex protein FliE